MKSEPIQRKLAAILSADVKGYSRLMGQDEAATVTAIRACREIMASAVAGARGRVVDPGGICVSGTLYDQVKRKVHYRYDFMGLQEVKNISEAVRAYGVFWKSADILKEPEKSKKPGKPTPLTEKSFGFVSKAIATCLLMLLLMPFLNHFKINLVTKMWQCRLPMTRPRKRPRNGLWRA